MLAAYAFLAIFTLQILAASVLYPTWFTRYLRLRAASIPAERLAQLYPGVDLGVARKRFLTQYRGLNVSIAVLGLVLLGWLFGYVRRPDWNAGAVEALVAVYFTAQMLLPLCLVAWHGVRFNKAHKRPLPERKRTALLQRRRLFDFVSPFMVFVAISSYFLFAAFLIYIQQHRFPGYVGLIDIGSITLVYAVQAFVVYATLYGKRSRAFETHAGRMRTVGLVVKSCVYSCIACVVFFSLNFTLGLLGWHRWEPFALGVFFVITAVLSLMGMSTPPRPPGAGGTRFQHRSVQGA